MRSRRNIIHVRLNVEELRAFYLVCGYFLQEKYKTRSEMFRALLVSLQRIRREGDFQEYIDSLKHGDLYEDDFDPPQVGNLDVESIEE